MSFITDSVRAYLQRVKGAGESYRAGGPLNLLRALLFRSYVAPPGDVEWNSAVFQYVKFNEGHPVIQGFVPASASFPGDRLELVLTGPGGSCGPVQSSARTRITYACPFSGDDSVTEGFLFRFPIEPGTVPGIYRVSVRTGSGEYPLQAVPGRHFPLSRKYRHAYFDFGNGLRLQARADGGYELKRSSWAGNALAEIRFSLDLLLGFSLEECAALVLRPLVRFLRLVQRRRIWIFSDKLDNPFDSAYSVALTLQTRPEFRDIPVAPYYLVGRNQPRTKEIDAHLPVLVYQSFKHVLYFLLADVHVTSEGGYNPITPRIEPYRDLMGHQLRVWSGHGIIHHEMSGLYGKDRQNFNLMTLGAKREREAMLGGLWGYEPDELVLTGLPRWDFREHRPGRRIYFIFTWRNELALDRDLRTFQRIYDDTFAASEFCRRLNAILASPELRDGARTHGYTLCFVPHPLLLPAMRYFTFPEHIEVFNQTKRYEEIYADADLLVTDYSSVAMDMAYLGKPVVYYQFDRERFYATQGYTPSFYSWDEDGFGAVVRTHEEAVARILEYMRTGCVREAEYDRRAGGFFPPRDKENGARALRAILDLKTRKNGPWTNSRFR